MFPSNVSPCEFRLPTLYPEASKLLAETTQVPKQAQQNTPVTSGVGKGGWKVSSMPRPLTLTGHADLMLPIMRKAGVLVACSACLDPDSVIVNVKKRFIRCVAAPAQKVRCDTRNLRDEARIRRARDAHRRRRRVRCGVRGLTPERYLQWRLIKPLNTTVAPTPRRVQFLLCRSSVSRV